MDENTPNSLLTINGNGSRKRLRIKGKNCLRLLLSQALELFAADSAAIIFGSDASQKTFLPAKEWDRGILRYLDGHGGRGFIYRLLGPFIARLKKINPLMLYQYNEQGVRLETEGFITFILRSYLSFYKTGVNVLIVPEVDERLAEVIEGNKADFVDLDMYSYDGKDFSIPDINLRFTVRLLSAFKVKNFLGVLIPNYGILVINTANENLLEHEKGKFFHEKELREKLDVLINTIEIGSLEILTTQSGKQGSDLLWHKEINLRKTARELSEKEIALNIKEEELEQQRTYLRAVGGVTEEQLNMEPVEVDKGVYTFIDMVGSASMRQYYSGEEYFLLTNTGRKIFALATNHFYCRLNNYIGDAVFIENNRVFDQKNDEYQVSHQERCILIILTLLDVFNELHLLVNGRHPIDPQGGIGDLLHREKKILAYRAGVEAGSAYIGPIGTEYRKIVTSIGKAVDNAARLESSGKPNAIHLSETMYNLIKDTVISQQTELCFATITNKIQRPGNLFQNISSRLLAGESLRFEQLYRGLNFSEQQPPTGDKTAPSVFNIVEGSNNREERPGRTYLLWPVHRYN